MHATFLPSADGQPGGGVPARSSAIPLDVLAASCALAALCLLQVWFCFLPTSAANLFYSQGTSSFQQFAALLVDMILLTGCFVALWGLSRGLRRKTAGERLGDMAFLLFLAIPVNAIRGLLRPVTAKLDLEYWRHVSVQGFSPALKLATGGCVVLLLAAVFYFHREVARVAYRMLVLLFPLVPFMLVEAAWVVTHRPFSPPVGQSHSQGRQAVATPGVHPGGRVVWIIFDEMDYRLAFESELNGRLHEFNRLARQSFRAQQAYPPGGRTLVSIPALLAGRFVISSKANDVSDLVLRYEGEKSAVRWSTGQTIFDEERHVGWRTGVAGWYFPYSRIFGSSVDAWQDQSWRLNLNPSQPFGQLMTDQFRVMVEGKSQSLLGKALSVMEHQRVVREFIAEATRKAADPALDLVFLHLPVPHGPFFYDAKTGQEAFRPRPIVGYYDHLQLADHVLGDIRKAMSEAGLSNRTTLLVSSDHWNREADLLDGKIDHRIPFLLRFPGDSGGLLYSAPFNTVLSRGLVTAIMEGEVHTAREAAVWIDHEKGSVIESPYNRN